MEPISTQMKNIMRVNGMLIREVGGVECIMQMELFTRESGTMINEMDKACFDYVSVMLQSTYKNFIPFPSHDTVFWNGRLEGF